MAYDLEEKMDMAINLLEENKNVVTNLQLYGGIGVSALFFHTKIKKHQKYKTIDIEIFALKKLQKKLRNHIVLLLLIDLI